MRFYKAFHPKNETLGLAIIATIEAMNYQNIRPLLKKHNLLNIQPDQWYPQQAELDLMREIVEQSGNKMDLVTIGMKIPDIVEYPVNINTVLDALTMLDAGYQHNHRGKNTGYFKHNVLDNNHVRMESHTPYPTQLQYGIIYRLVQKYRADKTKLMSVETINTPDGHENHPNSVFFDVKW